MTLGARQRLSNQLTKVSPTSPACWLARVGAETFTIQSRPPKMWDRNGKNHIEDRITTVLDGDGVFLWPGASIFHHSDLAPSMGPAFLEGWIWRQVLIEVIKIKSGHQSNLDPT